MKKIQLSILLILFSISIFAQPKMGPKIQWEEDNWNWGRIIMEKGVVSHVFKFMNVGDEPTKILEVISSCGCTAAEWTNESILPQKYGFVKVNFDPKGKLGINSKYVNVKMNSITSPYVLTLNGEVITNKWQTYKYKYQYGNLAVVNNKINVGRIKENNTYSFDIALANTGKKEIEIKRIYNSPNFKIEYKSSFIGIDDELVLRCVYSPIKPTIFGENQHEIKILTDDDTLALKSFFITSEVVEDFSVLTKKQIKRAPILSFDKTEEQFGTIKDTDIKTTLFKLSNNGKNNLVIRKIINKSESIEVSTDKTIIKKGEVATLTIMYSPKHYIGVDQRFINIITNDPKNSSSEVSIKSYVLPAE